jgi:hypothetical protein
MTQPGRLGLDHWGENRALRDTVRARRPAIRNRIAARQRIVRLFAMHTRSDDKRCESKGYSIFYIIGVIVVIIVVLKLLGLY